MKRNLICFFRYFLVIGSIISLALVMSACSSKSTSTSSSRTQPSGSLSSIAITPSSPPNLTLGYTTQFKAIGTYSDGSTADISNKVTWTTSDRTIVNLVSYIVGYGVVDGSGIGTANITASLDGITSPPVSLTVVAPASTTTSP